MGSIGRERRRMGGGMEGGWEDGRREGGKEGVEEEGKREASKQSKPYASLSMYFGCFLLPGQPPAAPDILHWRLLLHHDVHWLQHSAHCQVPQVQPHETVLQAG